MNPIIYLASILIGSITGACTNDVDDAVGYHLEFIQDMNAIMSLNEHQTLPTKRVKPDKYMQALSKFYAHSNYINYTSVNDFRRYLSVFFDSLTKDIAILGPNINVSVVDYDIMWNSLDNVAVADEAYPDYLVAYIALDSPNASINRKQYSFKAPIEYGLYSKWSLLATVSIDANNRLYCYHSVSKDKGKIFRPSNDQFGEGNHISKFTWVKDATIIQNTKTVAMLLMRI